MHPHVVAAIAQEEGLAADVGLLGEEGVVVAVLPVENLVCFQLEGAVALLTGPSAGDLDVHVLVVEHLSLGSEKAEVHRPVPGLVVVAGPVLSVAGLAVGAVAVAVDACLRVGEIFLVAHDADDGDGVLVGGLDVAAGDGHAGQVAVLVEAEREAGGLGDGELSVEALLAGVVQLAVAGVQLPGDVVEVEVVLLPVAVEVEGDGLHILDGLLASPPPAAAFIITG